jgi:hypothetical protein
VSSVLRGTVAASLLLGLIAIAISAAVGRLGLGVALAAGLAIGSTNGYLMVATINRRAPFVAASIFRMALLTSTALMVAIILNASAWAVLLGVGLAQIVMTAAGVREGLRA